MEPRNDSDLQDKLVQMRGHIEKLEREKLLQGDEIRAFKAEVRSYQDELRSLNSTIKHLEEQALQETLTGNIGKEVRLRYLERHRQRMGRPIGKCGYERIKCGDRAAHRGRPVVDAMLYLTGLITDLEAYQDLYGVNPEAMKHWRNVPEIVEITSFRASLQSEGRLTKDFQVLFERFLDVAKTDLSSLDSKAEFKENKTLQRLQFELQDSYDKIVAANPRGRQNSSSKHDP